MLQDVRVVYYKHWHFRISPYTIGVSCMFCMHLQSVPKRREFLGWPTRRYWVGSYMAMILPFLLANFSHTYIDWHHQWRTAHFCQQFLGSFQASTFELPSGNSPAKYELPVLQFWECQSCSSDGSFNDVNDKKWKQCSFFTWRVKSAYLIICQPASWLLSTCPRQSLNWSFCLSWRLFLRQFSAGKRPWIDSSVTK